MCSPPVVRFISVTTYLTPLTPSTSPFPSPPAPSGHHVSVVHVHELEVALMCEGNLVNSICFQQPITFVFVSLRFALLCFCSPDCTLNDYPMCVGVELDGERESSDCLKATKGISKRRTWKIPLRLPFTTSHRPSSRLLTGVKQVRGCLFVI